MKTAVVTGASRGIGLATTKFFLENGWQVIGTFNNTDIPIQHEKLTAVKLDLASSEDINRTAEHIKNQATTIDVLVNNAGVVLDGRDENINIDKIRPTFEVDLFALIDLTQKLLPLMPAGSHVINVDSNYGAQSFPIDDKTHVGYRLAKAALNMYTRILAFHLKDKGIRVSSLDPGWVKTDMGMVAATGINRPDKEPAEVAEEIYRIATKVDESGYFWHFGQKRNW